MFEISGYFTDSRRVARAGNEAAGLLVRVGSWAFRQGEDGWAPESIVRQFDRALTTAAKLVDVGIWVPGMNHGWEDGYWFADDIDPPLWRFHRPPPSRSPIPDEMRSAVYARDEYTCVTCGADDKLSLDHIHPRSKGGKDTFENLQTMCIPCNSRKGAKV